MKNNATETIDARDAWAAFDAIDAGLSVADALWEADSAALRREEAAAAEEMAQRAAAAGAMPIELARWYYRPCR